MDSSFSFYFSPSIPVFLNKNRVENKGKDIQIASINTILNAALGSAVRLVDNVQTPKRNASDPDAEMQHNISFPIFFLEAETEKYHNAY